MTRSAKSTADDYPQLEAFFCGYLHQDYPEEHGTVAGAVAAFRRDARRRAPCREEGVEGVSCRHRRRDTQVGRREADPRSWWRLGAAQAADLDALDALIEGL